MGQRRVVATLARATRGGSGGILREPPLAQSVVGLAPARRAELPCPTQRGAGQLRALSGRADRRALRRSVDLCRRRRRVGDVAGRTSVALWPRPAYGVSW